MEDNNYPQVEKAGIIGLVFSFLIPIVGVIIYFVQKNKVVNAASYLWAALAGFVLGLILNFVILPPQ